MALAEWAIKHHGLVVSLDFVVTGNDIGVGRGRRLVLCASLAIARHTLLMLRRIASRPIVGLPGGRLAMGLGLAAGLNVYIGDTVTALMILRYPFVVVIIVVGELGNDVPSVKKTRNEAKDAEQDINDGVGRADAALDPDYRTSVSRYSIGRRPHVFQSTCAGKGSYCVITYREAGGRGWREHQGRRQRSTWCRWCKCASVNPRLGSSGYAGKLIVKVDVLSNGVVGEIVVGKGKSSD